MQKESALRQYGAFLRKKGRADATIQKYLHECDMFLAQVNGLPSAESIACYINQMSKRRSQSTVNVAVSALNGWLEFMGMSEWKHKPLKKGNEVFRKEERELNRKEYQALLTVARMHSKRAYYIMLTLATSGIRVSELPYVTVESLVDGHTNVYCKGRRREVVYSSKLLASLKKYTKETGIEKGSIFVNRYGKPLSRWTIWRILKQIAKSANVRAAKVFPHNFRHYFAVQFLEKKGNIATLSSLLGHASIQTTMIYASQSLESCRRALDKILG